MENDNKISLSVHDAEKLVVEKMEKGGFGSVAEAIDAMKFHTNKKKLSEATRNRIVEAFNTNNL